MGFSSFKDLGRLAVLLVLSALLEVGGDAGMRTGLQGKQTGFVVGGLLLIAYGLVVNLSKLDFSKLMGIYIAVFLSFHRCWRSWSSERRFISLY